jgi:hypothetical protein
MYAIYAASYDYDAQQYDVDGAYDTDERFDTEAAAEQRVAELRDYGSDWYEVREI